VTAALDRPHPVRPCRHRRARHVHGTARCYNADNCRCLPCTRAWSRHQKVNRHRVATFGARSVLTAVPSVGIARRLQALAVVGWSTEDLAVLLRTAGPNVRRWQLGVHGFVTPTAAARVAAVYDAVWDQPPPGRYVLKVQRRAAKRGWLPPLAWDEDTIDDPGVGPTVPSAGASFGRDDVAVDLLVEGVLPASKVRPEERREAVRILAGRGLDVGRIAARTGMTRDDPEAPRRRPGSRIMRRPDEITADLDVVKAAPLHRATTGRTAARPQRPTRCAASSTTSRRR
jgi:hypothetical protein